MQEEFEIILKKTQKDREALKLENKETLEKIITETKKKIEKIASENEDEFEIKIKEFKSNLGKSKTLEVNIRKELEKSLFKDVDRYREELTSEIKKLTRELNKIKNKKDIKLEYLKHSFEKDLKNLNFNYKDMQKKFEKNWSYITREKY